MGSFGEHMRREREMRGITLEEIAESTKIGTRTLQALEEEDFRKLPGGIFNKGFVRAYARYLGIDEEQAISDFIAAAGNQEQPLPNPLPRPSAYPAEAVTPSVNWCAVAIFLVLVAALAVGLWKSFPTVHRLGHRVWSGVRVRLALRQNPAPPPITFGTRSASASPAVAGAPTHDASDEFVVSVRAKKDCWVSITADGQPLVEGQLRAAAEKIVRARNQIVLKTDPTGVEVSYNGKPLPPLGDSNGVTTVIFTVDGVQR